MWRDQQALVLHRGCFRGAFCSGMAVEPFTVPQVCTRPGTGGVLLPSHRCQCLHSLQCDACNASWSLVRAIPKPVY